MPVRLFAILAILATGLIAMKALSITDEVLALVDPAQPAWASGSKKTKKEKAKQQEAKEHAPPDITADPESVVEVKECTAMSFAQQAGLSEQELRVVMRLSERREELDSRERDLKTREAVVTLSEKQLDERLGRIEGAIAKYDERIGLLDEQEEARMATVVKTYEAMKPKAAAIIFNTLNDKVLLQLATRMKPQAMAKVLAAMETKQATQLTVDMAEQFARPASAEALLTGDDVPKEG